MVDMSALYHNRALFHHAHILPGVQVHGKHNIRDAVHCSVGGVRTFLLLFYYTDVIAVASASNNPGNKPSSFHTLPSHQASYLPMTLRVLGQMLIDSPGNQSTMLETQGFACLGHILTCFVSPAQVSLPAITVIENLLAYFSYLFPPKSKNQKSSSQKSRSSLSSSSSSSAGGSASTAPHSSQPRGSFTSSLNSTGLAGFGGNGDYSSKESKEEHKGRSGNHSNMAGNNLKTDTETSRMLRLLSKSTPGIYTYIYMSLYEYIVITRITLGNPYNSLI